eukprot:6028185-Alexandrium_andersonii.AAC.1
MPAPATGVLAHRLRATPVGTRATLSGWGVCTCAGTGGVRSRATTVGELASVRPRSGCRTRATSVG